MLRATSHGVSTTDEPIDPQRIRRVGRERGRAVASKTQTDEEYIQVVGQSLAGIAPWLGNFEAKVVVENMCLADIVRTR